MHKYNTPAQSIENYTPAGWRKNESCNRTAKSFSSNQEVQYHSTQCLCFEFTDSGSGDLFFTKNFFLSSRKSKSQILSDGDLTQHPVLTRICLVDGKLSLRLLKIHKA